MSKSGGPSNQTNSYNIDEKQFALLWQQSANILPLSEKELRGISSQLISALKLIHRAMGEEIDFSKRKR